MRQQHGREKRKIYTSLYSLFHKPSTMKQEIITRLHASFEVRFELLLLKKGVDSQAFARIRSKGDSALFGGRTTKEVKQKMGVPENRPLADFLPTLTIKAKDFAAEITNFNVKRDDQNGENSITKEHIKNNSDVRGLLVKRGIKPEELPPDEDIKKLERRVSTETKKVLKGGPRLK